MSAIIRARAPLRLGLAGGGSDLSPYCDEFGGAVINATINRFAFASFEPRTDGQVMFNAADLQIEDKIPASGTINTDDGLRIHRGVYNRMIADFNGGRSFPMTILTHVDSPLGSGLGSSSALVVCLIVLLAEVLGAPMGEYEIARLAVDIERNDLALHGGKQDQYAAAFGGFNFMEFSSADRVVVNPLRIKSSTLYELESSLILYFTGASRESASIIEQQIASVEIRGEALDAMHRLKDEALAMKEALLFGDVRDMARVMARSWDAKKATATAVSTEAIDRIISLSMASGALGGKVSGAGGGGFIMLLADPARRADVIRALQQEDGFADVTRFTNESAITWRPKAVVR